MRSSRVFCVGVLACLASPASALAQPARPAQPTRPAGQPARPAAQPARPAAQPARPAAQPTGPAAQVTPATPDPGAQVTPPTPPPPPPPPAPPPLRIAVTAGINGQFSGLQCDEGDPSGAVLSTVAGQLASEPDALVIDAGDLLGSAAVSRFVVEHDAAALATAVHGAGFRALAVGHRDLAADRATFLAAARALGQRNVPHVLSNLRCEAAGAALCEVVRDASDPPLVLDTPSGRVGVVSLMAPEALEGVSAERRAGLSLEALDEALPREVQRARAAGAARVIVTLDPRYRHELPQAMSLAGVFQAGQGPDAFVVQDLPQGVNSIEAAGSGVPVVAARAGGVVVIEPGAARVARHAQAGTPPTAVANFATATRTHLCSTLGRPTAGGRLEAPLERDRFAQLLLDVLRERTESEVAIINRSAVRAPEGLFPVRGAISQLTLSAAMPFSDSLQRVRMTGKQLKDFVAASRAEGFYIRGVTTEGGVKVNGRAVDDALLYTVVTTGYIAGGGDGGLGVPTAGFTRFGTGTLQETFASWLTVARSGDILSAPVDPATQVRWVIRSTTDFTFSSTTIRGNPLVTDPMGAQSLQYADPQLSRAQSVNLRFDTTLRFDADHPRYTWDNEARMRYGRASQVAAPSMAMPTPASTGFIENLDLITYNTSLTWRWFNGTRRWYMPLPTFLGYVETELNGPPSPRNPDFHHLLFRPTVGLRFELLERMTLNLTGGMNWAEVLAPDAVTGSSPEFAIVTTLTARPGTLFTLGTRAIEGGFSVDYTVSDPSDNQGQVVRASGRLSLPLFNPLALTLGYDLFARRSAATDWGLGHDATIGLRLAFTRAVQTF